LITARGRDRLDTDALDAAVRERAEDAFAFLERLVVAPSTVGNEATAQAVVAEELDRLGFLVSQLEIPDDIAEEPTAGIAQGSYAGRTDVLGQLGGDRQPSLLLNGHIDVVPAEQPDLWATDPFEPVRKHGWLHGRGAGDMKGGFAMATLAVDALRVVEPDAIAGSLGFLSVIEEECTGNGTLAACRHGILADAVLLPEPTGLDLLVAGVGILWLEIDVLGEPSHARSADRAVNPIEAAMTVIAALRELERDMNAVVDEAPMADLPHPYNVNVGTFHAGDWPSSVPARTRLGVRVGHPTAWSAEEAERRVRTTIADAIAADAWLRDHPPAIRTTGFRAEGYALATDHPFARRVSDAHASVHGHRPDVVAMGSTTDARYYLNGFDTPALCYGPKARNIHSLDEAVQLESIVDGARALARLVASWFASDEGDGS
jgi:acetylornithine deacetylase